jgi:tyrosine-protein phosphatase SIW14
MLTDGRFTGCLGAPNLSNGRRRTITRASASTVLLTFLLSLPCLAQTSPRGMASIRVENFGRVNDQYYRGAQPTSRDYADLAALGIKTVIDLRKGNVADEEARVRQAGMTFAHLPMSASAPPPEDLVVRFLQLVTNSANQPVFVHCERGQDRTGALTAIYRLTHDHWTLDRVYAEM